MTDEERLLTAIEKAPGDDVAWLALADALEEAGQPQRAELTRLTRSLRSLPRHRKRTVAEKRVVELLLGGVKPAVPAHVNSLGMRFALIPAGSFDMGSPPREKYRSRGECYHRVTLTHPFWLGVVPVTQDQYRRVMRTNPSHFNADGAGHAAVGDDDTSEHPVEDVTWEQAIDFTRRLSRRAAEKRAGRVYRLPTEAEWEYACRAGTRTPFSFGRNLSHEWAVYDSNRRPARTLPVGDRPPNAFGLYDMHGNVWEWCQDWYEEEGTRVDPATDPTGPASGTLKVLRGGSCYSNSDYCRSACRFHCVPDHIAYRCRGLRVVLAHGRAATRR